jgi:glycosyltransferase involved in cell wall biosynthesis
LKLWLQNVVRPFRALYRVVTIEGLRVTYRRAEANAACPYVPEQKSLLYVAATCLPYHISGYTTRTQAVLSSLKQVGVKLYALTRPGYPWDRKDRLLTPIEAVYERDGVVYDHCREPSHHRPLLMYALQAVKPIVAMAKKHRVSAMQAASNHVNALPALLAARRLGIPFFYEMRGLWELTRVSRMPEFEGSEAFKQGLALEGFVARNADRVYVISEQLGRYAVEHWGADPAKMALLPNCVDPEDFVPADPALVEPNTIGYAGSLLDYEGMDVLIRALAVLKDQGVALKLRVVGEGEVRVLLESLVEELRLADRVSFLGRQPPEAAREVIMKSAVVCLPRKPFEVCQIVTPIKLVEALAMGKPVIVPDLPVFKDELMLEAGVVPGWFFKAGDAADLAAVLRSAFADAGLLAEKSLQARHHAVTMRNWQRYVQDIYKHLPDGGN